MGRGAVRPALQDQRLHGLRHLMRRGEHRPASAPVPVQQRRDPLPRGSPATWRRHRATVGAETPASVPAARSAPAHDAPAACSASERVTAARRPRAVSRRASFATAQAGGRGGLNGRYIVRAQLMIGGCLGGWGRRGGRLREGIGRAVIGGVEPERGDRPAGQGRCALGTVCAVRRASIRAAMVLTVLPQAASFDSRRLAALISALPWTLAAPAGSSPSKKAAVAVSIAAQARVASPMAPATARSIRPSAATDRLFSPRAFARSRSRSAIRLRRPASQEAARASLRIVSRDQPSAAARSSRSSPISGGTAATAAWCDQDKR